MRVLFILLLCSIAYFSVKGSHLVVGNVSNRVALANQTKVEYAGFPFMKRVKFFFYNTPDNRPIRGIQALDPLHTKSSVNVTAGGVGFPFVNLRMKSERGTTMIFDIGIYVDDLRYQR